MARPTKFNDQREASILNALRAGNTRKAAAGFAGVDQHTLTRWIDRSAHFAAAVQKAESDAEVRHVAGIPKAAQDGIWTASAWWLERRRAEDWGRKDRIDIVAVVRVMAAQAGLSDEETSAAVAEAERYVKELASAGAR